MNVLLLLLLHSISAVDIEWKATTNLYDSAVALCTNGVITNPDTATLSNCGQAAKDAGNGKKLRTLVNLANEGKNYVQWNGGKGYQTSNARICGVCCVKGGGGT